MLRKVVQHGPSTMIVSLPIKWVKKNSIAKGDELHVSEENNSIVINIDKQTEEKNAEIDISNLSRSAIMFYIRSIYRQGYDEIIVRFNNPKTTHFRVKKEVNVLSVIHTEVNRLIGVEITQQKENFCIIKDLSGVSTTELDTIIRRIFLLMKDTISDMVVAINNKEFYKLETIEEKHDTITKFISYCLRLLNKQPNFDAVKKSGLYHALCSIDLGIDYLKYFSRYVIIYKPEFCKNSLEVLEQIKDIQDLLHEIFFNFDLDKAMKFMELRANAKYLLDEIPENCSPQESASMFYIASYLELARDLLETKMSITPPKQVP